jgi:pimeloyl-ACP methyl ester carboxylesterase
MDGAGGGRGRGVGKPIHGAAFLAVLLLVSLLAPPASAAPKRLSLGAQKLKLCSRAPVGYCGKLAVALDHNAAGGPKINVAYTFFPATEAGAAGAKGTVVPVEGGPGYPSGESVAYSAGGRDAGFRAMYGPLLGQRNMLVIDNRGTGRSGVLNCPALQQFSGPTGTAAFQQTVGACAESLNHHWRGPDGSFLHASDLFNTAPAARDMAEVIGALGLGRVDLYGDSYGSFFAQVFAARFPRLLRSVTLDSTYPSAGLDPWYRSSIASMPDAFDAACGRGPACAAAAPGSSWSRIQALAASLRARAISGRVPGPEGKLESVSMNAVGLLDLVSDGAADPLIYQQLDAAARAYLQQGEAAPLLRLYDQRLSSDEAYFGQPLKEYSVALYFASACTDYPQLFDLGAPAAQRAQELLSAEEVLPSRTFDPFTIAEWLSQNENTEALTGCLQWPRPTVAEPPIPSGGLPLPSTLPVLVLGGELDTWTPPVDSPKVLAEIGGNSRFIELANATHVVGQQDTICASTVIEEFVARPQDIQKLEASCAPEVPPIHTVGVYPSKLAGEPPLVAGPGSGAGVEELRLAAAAVASGGDAVARYAAIEAPTDAGLLGGRVLATHEGRLLTLTRDQLIPGVQVSGTVRLSPAPIAEDAQAVVAQLSVVAPGVRHASFTATWTTSGANAMARVAGTIEGRTVSGTMPAP